MSGGGDGDEEKEEEVVDEVGGQWPVMTACVRRVPSEIGVSLTSALCRVRIKMDDYGGHRPCLAA